jgi:hypothetical protein
VLLTGEVSEGLRAPFPREYDVGHARSGCARG